MSTPVERNPSAYAADFYHLFQNLTLWDVTRLAGSRLGPAKPFRVVCPLNSARLHVS